MSTIVITGGFRYDGHMITFVGGTKPGGEEPSTYINLDLLLTTLSNSTDPVEVRFYPHNFEGSVHESFTDKVVVTAGKETTVKLNLDNYLVDGKFTGIGFAIFGGPEWNTEISNGVYD